MIATLMFWEGAPAWKETRCRSSIAVQPPSFKVISMSQSFWGHHCPPISSRSFRQRKEHRILYFPPRRQQILVKSVNIKERPFSPQQDACSIRWGGDNLSCTTWAGVAGVQCPFCIQGSPAPCPRKPSEVFVSVKEMGIPHQPGVLLISRTMHRYVYFKEAT